MKYEAVVIGGSAGGLDALEIILTALPADFPGAVATVIHISPDSDNYMIGYLDRRCRVTVKEAEDKEMIQPGRVYMAPPNYHLLINSDRSLMLSAEPRVNYSRPAVDPLFETAADAVGPRLIGVLLSGANQDGSRGLRRIQENGGLTIVQSPETTRAPQMVQAARAACSVDHVLSPEAIGTLINRLFG